MDAARDVHHVQRMRALAVILALLVPLAAAAKRPRRHTEDAPAPSSPREARVASLDPATRPPSPDEPRASPPLPPVERTTVVVSETRRWDLVGGGLALFVASWAVDVGASYGIGNADAAHALVPLVGPLIQLGDRFAVQPPMHTGNPQIDAQIDSKTAQVNDSIQTAAYAILAVDFALQLTGVVLAIAGVASHRTHLRYERPLPIGASTATLRVVPGPNPSVALTF